jgi:hypothetical protein
MGVKDLLHCGLKTLQLSGKLGMLFGGFGEVQQLLADQIIQSVFQAESPARMVRVPGTVFSKPCGTA